MTKYLAWLKVDTPEWSRFQVASYAEYLSFIVDSFVGSHQWDITTKGLYSTSSMDLFPIGTQHTVEVSCASSGSEVDSIVVGDNFRESGVRILVPYWSKLVNTFMMILSLSLAVLISSSNRLVKLFARDFFAGPDGTKQRRTLS